MENAIIVKGLSKTFGAGETSVPVIRDLDFSMKSGSFESVMGPSGSGKSTFLHLLAGLIGADAGTIEIGGRMVTGLSDGAATVLRRRHIGLIFQDFNLVPTLTAEENVALPLLLDGTYRGERREHVGRLLDILAIAHRRDHLPDRLSGGERQRVAIARALAGNPDVVLADEPTGNLDSPAAKSLCDLLRRLNAEMGSTILVVSHDPIVAAVTDRVHLLRDGAFAGSFEPCGDPALVMSRYLSAMAPSPEKAP